MAMGPERSKPLHNFTLPCGLKWGNQKFMRCVKVDSDVEMRSELIGRRRELGVVERHRPKFRSVNGDSGDGIEAVREKLMFDLQTETDKMKNAILRDGLDAPSPAPAPVTTVDIVSDAGAVSVADLSRPWNLRTRRAACNELNGSVTGAGVGGSKETNGLPPLRTENNKSSRLRSEFPGGAIAGASSSGEKRQRVKFSVSLSRREIEEDFMAMVGHRPPRRPKKRARLVQKNLDTLFPGLWLTEVTADLYKVAEDH